MELDYKAATQRYRHLFWGATVPKNTQYPAFRAYILFDRWIEDFVQNGPSDDASPEETAGADGTVDEGAADELASDRLEALLNAVLERLKLVVISLGESDDAQVIFETLNSKGEPLLAMDLVRNNIFHRAEKQGVQVEELYRKPWDPLDHAWWREPAPNARPTRPRIDHFLAHALAAETGAKISMRELYAEYRAFAVPKGRPRYANVEDELGLLGRFAPLYELLEGRTSTDPDLFWFGRKMAAWQVTTVFPVAMQVGMDGVDRATRATILRLLYSYLVRRALCDLTTKNLNNVFNAMAANFVEKGVSVASFKAFFVGRAGDSSRFPDDDELRRGILETNAYAIAPRSRLVDTLWELELASRTKLAERNERPEGLWIEHVMPRTWTEDWPFFDAEYDGPWGLSAQAVARRAALDTLGNLTLVSGGLNISAGNGSLSDKQAKFAEHTGLFLNKWFASRLTWMEAGIAERGEHLFGLARLTWPGLAVE